MILNNKCLPRLTRHILVTIALLFCCAGLSAQLEPGLLLKTGFETLPPITNGPSIQGIYQVDSEFLPLDPIPDPMQPAIAAIDEFFDSPGVALMRIMGITAEGDGYHSNGIWDLFFDPCIGPGDPLASCFTAGEVVPTIFGLDAGGLVEVQLDIGMAAIGGIEFQAALSAGKNTVDEVENFVLSGILNISQDPDVSGNLGSESSIIFNSATWRWTGNEAMLSLSESDALEGESIEATMVLHPRDGETTSLRIEPTLFVFRYPLLLFNVVEQVIFPVVLDPVIESLSDVFVVLIDCDDLADSFETTYGFVVAIQIVSMCEVIRITSVMSVRDWLDVAAPGQPDQWELKTPPNNPCPLVLDPKAKEPTVLALGGPSEQQRCPWDTTIGDGMTTTPMQGSWWGSRF